MNQLSRLTRMFAKYNIYPKHAIHEGTPFRVYQREHLNEDYVRQMELILQEQPETPTQRGADLPWWGKQYFSDKIGKRTMVISQDSLSSDAGSIVFYACFMPDTRKEYVNDWIKKNGLPGFRSWEKARSLVNELVDWDYCYITDASKVYRINSWKDRDFDKNKSHDLLISEIGICDPDLIIILGAIPMVLLRMDEKFSEVVGQKIVRAHGRNVIVSPFPSIANANRYEERKSDVIELVRRFWNSYK